VCVCVYIYFEELGVPVMMPPVPTLPRKNNMHNYVYIHICIYKYIYIYVSIYLEEFRGTNDGAAGAYNPREDINLAYISI